MKKQIRVIVSVQGGVARPAQVPKGVTLEIHDFDNVRDGGAKPDGYDDHEGYTSAITKGNH
jgi:hypothetical protein